MERTELQKGDKVIHYKTKGEYEIVYFGLVQIHNAWHSCVIYKNEKEEIFVRTKGEFQDSFTKSNLHEHRSDYISTNS